MVAKRYTVLSILVVAALAGTCGNGFADQSCAAICANRQAMDFHNCPPPHSDDARAYFECVVKAHAAEETCDIACPNNISKPPEPLMRK